MTDRKLKRTALRFRRGILGRTGKPDRMCFAVCAPLETLLALQGVDVRLKQGEFLETNHVWLELPDGRILDPTADQFGLEPIYLGPLPDLYLSWMAAALEPA